MVRIIQTSISSVVMTLIFMLIGNAVKGQSGDSLALVNADTTHFAVNGAGGWKLYNSYINEYTSDSIRLELIVRNDSNNIQWSGENYIGRIKTEEYVPDIEQVLYYQVLSVIYGVRIDSDGRCFIRLVSGLASATLPLVIPLIVSYER